MSFFGTIATQDHISGDAAREKCKERASFLSPHLSCILTKLRLCTQYSRLYCFIWTCLDGLRGGWSPQGPVSEGLTLSCLTGCYAPTVCLLFCRGVVSSFPPHFFVCVMHVA